MIKSKPILIAIAVALNLGACTIGRDDSSRDTLNGPLTDIRFYTSNRDNQEDRLKLIRKSREPGCHNLSKYRKAHRVAVFSFESCTVFAQPDCATESAIAAEWTGRTYSKKKREARTTELGVGTRWIIGPVLDGTKTNVPIRSWQCR